jgi:hypothetical protein
LILSCIFCPRGRKSPRQKINTPIIRAAGNHPKAATKGVATVPHGGTIFHLAGRVRLGREVRDPIGRPEAPAINAAKGNAAQEIAAHSVADVNASASVASHPRH